MTSPPTAPPAGDAPSIPIPPKCDACKDTGEVEARVQYHTHMKLGRTCRMEKIPCPFCENGLMMDRKRTRQEYS